jgi:hypothetical protein
MSDRLEETGGQEMTGGSSLSTLAELLRGVRPIVDIERMAPSTIYDLQYRIAVTACAFEIHASEIGSQRRIHAGKLKLFQFMAIRPWLVPVLTEWAASERDTQPWLALSQRLRRGFVGDQTFDRVIDFLAARDVVRLIGVHVISGSNVAVLARSYSATIEQDIFASERSVLLKLKDIRVTNQMVEGQ